MAKNGTIAYVKEAPLCDFCKQGGVERKALYDFKTSWGPWANGCEVHYRTNRLHTELGIGYGQKFVVGEPPNTSQREVRQSIMAAIESGNFDEAEDLIGDGDIAEWL